MKSILAHFIQSRLFWLGVFLLCVVLDGGALFYQHVLGQNEDGLKIFYQPCELCIYIRVWISLIAIFSVFAMVLCKAKWVRRLILGIQSWLVIGLSLDVYSLLKIEYQFGEGGSCNIKANFYDWAPLDQWMPNMFEVIEMCKATPVIFGPVTMVHGLTMFCVCLLGVFVIGAVQEWKKSNIGNKL